MRRSTHGISASVGSRLFNRVSVTGVIVAALLSASRTNAGGCTSEFWAHPASDPAAYFRLCQSLAEQGNAEAQFDLGWLYELDKDYEAALKWYRKSAEAGYEGAQINLGDAYFSGRLMPKDYAEAAKWWSKAADHGHPNVKADLGSLYEQGGNGLLQNYAASAVWYREAAEQGDRNGQFGLGRLYAEGNGVPQDYVFAHMWLNLAGAQGLDPAKVARDMLVSKMTPAQVAEAQRLAREWKPTE